MEGLLGSLAVGLSVKDQSFKAAMAVARKEVAKTGQDFDRNSDTMAGAVQRAALAVDRFALRIVDSMDRAQRATRTAGIALIAGITVPTTLMGKAAKDAASDFQAGMNKVNAAMMNASPEQLTKLRQAALDLGPAMGRSAVEAAGAIEMLAKNGMSASAILNGGLAASLRLAAVGQTELSGAADLTTDIMVQFNKTSADLPSVVNRVSGALDVSKLGFEDYAGAIAQAGGVAGGLGFSFEDLNVALAATSSLFASGSDAGTSFKTFLTSLSGNSKEAQELIKNLGLRFFDAQGNARGLSEIAEELRTKLSGLNDQAKQDVLKTIFGTDAIRTAIGLMNQGAQGIEQVRASIDAVSADQKLSVLLDGEANATQRLASSWEKLKIAIGDAGIIQALTLIKNTAATAVSALAAIPEPFLYMVNVAGLAAASLGPLLLVATKLGPVLLSAALMAGRLGGALGALGTGIGVLINPAGVLIQLLGRLALQAGATTMLGRLGAGMLGFAGSIGLVITALTLLVPLIMKGTTASQRYTDALDKAREATDASTEVVNRLATAQGRAKVEALAMARADRVRAAAAVATARADLQAARAASLRARAYDAKQDSTMLGRVNRVAASPGIGIQRAIAGMFGITDRTDRMQAAVDQKAAADVVGEAVKRFNALDAAIKNAENGLDIPSVTVPGDTGGSKKDKSGASGKSAADTAREAAQREARYQDDLGQSRVAQLRAQADLTDSARARYAADMAALAQEREAYARQIANDADLTEAKRTTLMAEKDKELSIRRQIAEQERFNALAQEDYDLAQARNEAEQELARSALDTADSIAGRRAGELRLLDLQRQQEEADLDLILATKSSASVEWQNAMARKDRLDSIYADRRAAVERQNEGPGASYMRWLDRSPDAIGEDIQDGAVSALKDLNSQIADAITGAGSLASAFANMAKRIVSSLIEIAVQQSIIKPLATALLGAGGSGGGLLSGLGSSLGRLFGGGSGAASVGVSYGGGLNTASPLFSFGAPIDFPRTISYGGGRAVGGAIQPNKWYMVGEDGPEPFYSGIRGTVLPNGSLDASSGRRGPTTVNMGGVHFSGGVDLATRTEVYRVADAARQAAMSGVSEANKRRA